MEVTTKFNVLEHVMIIPLDNKIGRIVEIQIAQMICYRVEYWVESEIKTVILYEDELSKKGV